MQVTRLADSATPADLAAVVAGASGLGRWNEEIGAAEEELRRTRAALEGVRSDLAVLARRAEADAELGGGDGGGKEELMRMQNSGELLEGLHPLSMEITVAISLAKMTGAQRGGG